MNKDKISYYFILILTFSAYILLTIPHIDTGNYPEFKFLIIGLAPIVLFILYKASKYIIDINIWLISLSAFCIYMFWGIYASPIPYSDFLDFYTHSVQLAINGDIKTLYDTKSPGTIVYYALFVALFGKSHYVFYIASSLIWALQIPLIYTILDNFKIEKNRKKFITLLYAFYPGTIFYATVISSESVFLFLLLLSLYYISKVYNDSLKSTDSIVFGLTMGVFFLTRSSALLFIATFFIYIIFKEYRNKKKLLLLFLSFSMIISMQLFLNIKYENKVSIATSPWGQYVFLNGTNYETKGQYSSSDLILAGFIGTNKVSMEQAQKNAITIAITRISNDPLKFIQFALTDKINSLWGTDTHNIRWSIGESPRKEEIRKQVLVGMGILDTVFFMIKVCGLLYLITILFNYKYYYKEHKNILNFIIIMVIPLLLLSVLHIFIEVQSRYHMPFMPFLIIITGMFIFEIDHILKYRIKRG